MGVLKVFLYGCAAAFLLGGILIPYFFGFGLVTLLALAAGAGLAYATFGAAQKFNVSQSDNQKFQLEQTFKQLAAKSDGSVALEALMNATGLPKEQLQTNMRLLVGKGICELDYGPNGEPKYKATPLDEARANLAGMAEQKKLEG